MCRNMQHECHDKVEHQIFLLRDEQWREDCVVGECSRHGRDPKCKSLLGISKGADPSEDIRVIYVKVLLKWIGLIWLETGTSNMPL